MTYNSTILANSPTVFWPLDDNVSGIPASIADASGNGHTGTLNVDNTYTSRQPSLLAGDPSAFSFVFTGANIAAASAPGPGTGDFAVEAWFKTTDTSAYKSPVGFVGSGNTAVLTIYGNALYFIYASSGIAGPTTLCDGNPHHVVGVRRSGTVHLYVDGVEVGTPAADSTNYGTTGTMWGAALGSNVQDFSGSLQKIAYYVGTLAASDVTAHYNAGSGGVGDTTPPVVSSANADTTGTTLTIGFTETGSLPVLPASGATGFTLSASGGAVSLSSPAISGTTYTARISRTILAGETLTLAYAPGNVTDSAGTPNAMASFSGTSVTNNGTHTSTLTSGPASFVSSGPASILVTCADATGGTPPYTYQWQRNFDGGSYSNISNGSGVSGATTRTMTDGSPTTAHLYGYRMITTDSAGTPASVTSNAVSAMVYPGGSLAGGVRRVTLGGGF
jgi:hypothetical protein